VTHNNEGHGLRFWFNDKWAHNVRDTAIYNNGGVGIENGAYTNAIRYENVLVLNNQDGGILHHSSSSEQFEDGGPSRYTNVRVEGPGAPLEIGRLRGTAKTRQEFIDCDLGREGKIVLDANDKTENRFLALFRNCGDLTPGDVVFGGPNGTFLAVSFHLSSPTGKVDDGHTGRGGRCPVVTCRPGIGRLPTQP
jgi:hypothetical protein